MLYLFPLPPIWFVAVVAAHAQEHELPMLVLEKVVAPFLIWF